VGVAATRPPSLHFGLVRQRQIVSAITYPFFLATLAVIIGANWWVLIAAVPLSLILGVLAFRTRLSVDDGRFVIHRLLSTVSVDVADVGGVAFAAGRANRPGSLVLGLRNGQGVIVKSVSLSRRLAQAGDVRSAAEQRVDQFLEDSGLHLRVERGDR